jgi:hypothetical protein
MIPRSTLVGADVISARCREAAYVRPQNNAYISPSGRSGRYKTDPYQ